MKYAWPFFILVSALVIAIVVFAILNLQPPVKAVDGVSLAVADGTSFSLGNLRGRLWVAGFLGPCSAPCPNLAWMNRLRRDLPPGVELLGISLDPTGAAPEGWTAVHGSADRIREIAVTHWGFADTQIDELVAGNEELLACVVTPSGGIGGRYAIPAGSGELALRSLLDDVDFVGSLARRPRLHAQLNAMSAVILMLGFVCIRMKKVGLHVACMVGAAVTTVVFLTSYLYYHSHAGSMPFRGESWARPIYFGILISHTVLAAFVAPLAATLFYLGARRRFRQHKRIARWSLPIWLYVSITGVLIYCMLYIWFRPA